MGILSDVAGSLESAATDVVDYVSEPSVAIALGAFVVVGAILYLVTALQNASMGLTKNPETGKLEWPHQVQERMEKEIRAEVKAEQKAKARKTTAKQKVTSSTPKKITSTSAKSAKKSSKKASRTKA